MSRGPRGGPRSTRPRPLPPENARAPRVVERRGFIEPFTALNVLCPDDGHPFVPLSNTAPCDIHRLPYAPGLPLDLLQPVYGRDPQGPSGSADEQDG